MQWQRLHACAPSRPSGSSIIIVNSCYRDTTIVSGCAAATCSALRIVAAAALPVQHASACTVANKAIAGQRMVVHKTRTFVIYYCCSSGVVCVMVRVHDTRPLVCMCGAGGTTSDGQGQTNRRKFD